MEFSFSSARAGPGRIKFISLYLFLSNFARMLDHNVLESVCSIRHAALWDALQFNRELRLLTRFKCKSLTSGIDYNKTDKDTCVWHKGCWLKPGGLLWWGSFEFNPYPYEWSKSPFLRAGDISFSIAKWLNGFFFIKNEVRFVLITINFLTSSFTLLIFNLLFTFTTIKIMLEVIGKIWKNWKLLIFLILYTETD